MTGDFLVILLAGTLSLGGPLVLAAMGGYLSERGGIINIGLEGKMLSSACITALVAAATGDALTGVGAGILAATALSVLHWCLTQTYRIDAIVSGIAINLIAAGATNFLAKRFTDLESRSQIPQLPLVVFTVLALLAPVTLWWWTRSTRPGLHLNAVGGDPDKARQMGLEPLRIRLGGLIGTGLLTGLAGALIVTNAGRFTDNMTGGKGFIALAALILGRWKPIPAALAALVFGMFEALQIQLQGTPVFGVRLPSEFWLALPFVVTIIALAGLLGRNRPPEGLGKI